MTLLTTPGALSTLRQARRVALICHSSPDNDCIGGLMALTHVLRARGQTAYPLSPDPIPDYLLHVPGSEEVPVAVSKLPEVDLVVAIEAASLERMDPIWTNAREQLQATPVLNIDHHLSNTGYGTERIFDPQAAAVCEMLYHVVQKLGTPIDETIAYCLLTGVVGDTRSFRTSSTTPETLRVTSELIAAGAPLNRVSDAVNKFRTAAELGIWAAVLERARYEDGVLWTMITHEEAQRRGLALEQLDGIVEFLSDTRDVAVSVVLKLLVDGRVRVSMRSDGSVDLTKIAKIWNGGGHPQASGCTIVGVPLREAEHAVVTAIQRALRHVAAEPAG